MCAFAIYVFTYTANPSVLDRAVTSVDYVLDELAAIMVFGVRGFIPLKRALLNSHTPPPSSIKPARPAAAPLGG